MIKKNNGGSKMSIELKQTINNLDLKLEQFKGYL